MNKSIRGILVALGLYFVLLAGLVSGQNGTDGNEPVFAAPTERQEILSVSYHFPILLFNVNDERVSMVRLWIQDLDGHLIFDSGEMEGVTAAWDTTLAESQTGEYQALVYELHAWDEHGQLVQRQAGEIQQADDRSETPLMVTTYDVAGNFTVGGYLGVGTSSPERAVHIRGSNAVFRMDRSSDTAAFMIVRNDDSGNILKSYVVGVNASGPNKGSFVINDLGQATGGGGTNRLTIDNDGNAIFSSQVKAAGYVTISSRQFKTDIQPLQGALDKVMQLQSVTFKWKDTGTPSIGLIAEDVAGIAPEVVSFNDHGRPAGIDYGRVSALLLESVKTQQVEIEQIKKDCDSLEARLEKELQEMQKLKDQGKK